MKKIISIIMAAVMLFSLGVAMNAAAIPENEIMPLWDNTTSVTNSVGFVNGKGIVDCEIYGDAGTTVTGQVKVYRQNPSGVWSYVGGKSGSSDTRLLNIVMYFTAISGCYYKSVLTTTVTKNGVGETITKTSYKTCP